jgi:CelD/BcsL family acetyltransferase involved in cellulose biosynthesis
LLTWRKSKIMSIENFKHLYDEQAHAALRNDEFLELWRVLHGKISYATALQEPEYVCTWYEEYRNNYKPVIFCSSNSKGDLIGLFFLAYNPKLKLLVNAGAQQAEYHMWLALPGEDIIFFSQAWIELVKAYSFAKLEFRYLPVELGDILKNVPNIRSNVIIQRRNRPLLKIVADDIKTTFAKKNNKSKFNRLRKLGMLEFIRIYDPVEHERVLDDLINFYDFRQAAVNHTIPFRQDPKKRQFYINLFATNPSKFHITVTYLDKKPIAGLWGVISGKMVSIGMIMHSPFFAEYSPGKVHIMLLSQLLLEENMELLDITPGNAPWKERFGNANDEVCYVLIFRSKSVRFFKNLFYELSPLLKRSLELLGVTPTKIRYCLSTLISNSQLSTLIQRIKNWVNEKRNFRIYRIKVCSAANYLLDEKVHFNSINDLLCFEQNKFLQTNDNFFSNALTRLYAGEHVYTVNIDNHLAFCGWMVLNPTEKHIPEVNYLMKFPPRSILLHDLSLHSDFMGSDLYRTAIGHMLHEAIAYENTQYIYNILPSYDISNCKLVESIGFEYQGSLFWQRRFGIEKKDLSVKLT